MMETAVKKALKDRSADKAAQHMLAVAEEQEICTIWERHEAMQPQCGFGTLGLCCRNCHMGPCRIDPFGDGAQVSVCGATRELMIARNLVKDIAAGAACHSDHGRDIAHTLLLAAEGGRGGYQITDEVKLNKLATEWQVKTEGRKTEDIARDVAHIAMAEFGKQEGQLRFVSRVPGKRLDTWKKYNMVPRGIDREIVEVMNRANVGVDNDFRNIMYAGMRAALADGWGGSMIATELSDILFKRPRPLRARVNLGVLREDHVNIVVHGHEPTLSMMIVRAARDPGLVARAQEVGAKGINLAGICCTANEVLMRFGVPVAGNYLHQELAIITGAVEAMVVDVQCVLPYLSELARTYHTEVITTSPKGRNPGTTYIEFREEQALDIAKDIVTRAIERFKMRDARRVNIPKDSMDLIAGFTTEEVFLILGGKYRATYRPLNDGIMAGRLRGVAAIVGCNNPKFIQDYSHMTMAKELLRHDVLVVETGCSAIACAKEGLLKPEAVYDYGGKGLIEICEAAGIPPVLHLGACVDISRILTACCEMINEGGIGTDFSELPAAGAAPEWMSEKAIAIGHYVIATGIFTVLGEPLAVLGSKDVTRFLTEEMEQISGGKFAFEPDPMKAAHLIIQHLDRKREALKLRPMMYPPRG